MRTAILSRHRGILSTRRLVKAGRRAGIPMRVMDPYQFSMLTSRDSADLFYRGKRAPRLDAIIPRVAASTDPFGLAVVRQFEHRGVLALNSSRAISRCRDKFRTIQILSRRGIRVPATALHLRGEDVRSSIRKVGGLPVILKVLKGSQGKGVFLAETEKTALSIFRILNEARHYVLIQRFVKECRGRDLRAFVVGDRVVAAMRRTASGKEFRSNVHLGGQVVAVDLPDEFARTAVRAARAIGLDVAGVDLLEADEGPLVLEVNSSPGLQGIERVTGMDIAGEVIAYLKETWRARRRVSA